MGTTYVDPRQRFSDLEEVFRVALESLQVRLWTSLPGIIISFDADAITAKVQPAIQGAQLSADGSTKFVNLPVLPDVPVEFPHGGGCTLTFPVKEGDDCTLEFSSRCIDVWWQQGGVQPPYEPRMHNLSDAICRVGPFSQPKKISGISTTTVQLRDDAGETVIELDPTAQIVNIVAPGGVNIDAPTVAITGAVTVSDTLAVQGNITTPSDVIAGTIPLKTHHTSLVASGAGTSGPPVP